MKTRLLKKLRKKAVQNVYVTRKTGGYAVWQQYTIPVKREQFDEIEEARDFCNYLRRKNIIEMLDDYRAKKKRRVY